MSDHGDGPRDVPSARPEQGRSGLELAERSLAEIATRPRRFVQRVARRLLRSQLDRQTDFDAGVLQAAKEAAAGIEELRQRAGGIESHLAAGIEELRQRAGGIEPRFESLDARLAAVERHLPDFTRDVEADFAAVRSSVHAQGRQLDELAGELVAATADAEEIQREWDEARCAQHALAEHVRTLERRLEPLRSMDHFDFALRYRGDPEVIRERLKKYAQVFGPVERVLDFGCGRGEFLEICGEMQIGAYGVDSDPDMVSHCRLRRVNAKLGDAMEHLRNLPNRYLDGFFSAQVVEHLTPAELAELVRLASDKLKRGARLVIETINPNTFSALRWFFLDPTHCKPVPAELLRFLLEEASFQVLDIMMTSPVPEDERLAFPKPDTQFEDPAVAELLGIVNENSRRLNEVIFGPQDYAIIAER